MKNVTDISPVSPYNKGMGTVNLIFLLLSIAASILLLLSPFLVLILAVRAASWVSRLMEIRKRRAEEAMEAEDDGEPEDSGDEETEDFENEEVEYEEVEYDPISPEGELSGPGTAEAAKPPARRRMSAQENRIIFICRLPESAQ
ncbi:MAG: hypothetical protein RDV48_26800 [Candidatus Eremiobacteraeota bacterium]|nr:hypothetical protein [Candidatus Eremiobacteraeota bacterium]